MNLVVDPLGYAFFVRALVASAIVGLVCATVGSYMVLRGLAFMGDALSHSAFPGVVVAYMVKGPFYLGASLAAVGTALAIGWVTRQGKVKSDAAIGVLFAGMFALGVFLFSLIPNYVGDLLGFLFGEVLGIGVSDLISLTVLGVLVLGTVALLWKELLYSTFDPLGAAASGLPVSRLDYLLLALIALTIVISLQAVGIVLVVAMLVTPAATAQAALTELRPPRPDRGHDRSREPDRRAVRQLLAQLRQRRHGRPGGERRVCRDPRGDHASGAVRPPDQAGGGIAGHPASLRSTSPPGRTGRARTARRDGGRRGSRSGARPRR